MIPVFYIKEQGQRGCCPFPLHPKSPPTQPPLRCGLSRFVLAQREMEKQRSPLV